MVKIIYVRDLIVEHSITQITYKHVNQYSADVFDNYKINEAHDVKKAHYNFSNGVAINKHNTLSTNDTYNISKTNNTFNTTDNQYFTKKIEHKHNITNNITRHNHKNYEHNVIKKVHKHIQHINNYDTEVNYYSKKSLNMMKCYNFYNDNFYIRTIENISIPQQQILQTITLKRISKLLLMLTIII